MIDLRYRPVVIVASGPSLTDQQCSLISARREADACRVIVVNDNFKRIRNADILFAADGPWWRHNVAEVGKLVPAMARWSCEGSNRQYGCQYWLADGSKGGIAPRSENAMRRGASSGFMAVGLSVKLGARHIVLVGMDCKRARDGRAHWFGDHDRKKLPSPQPFDLWRDEFNSLAKPALEMGIDLVNCTIDTSITQIRRSTLEAELFSPDEAAEVAEHLAPGKQVHHEQHDHQQRNRRANAAAR